MKDLQVGPIQVLDSILQLPEEVYKDQWNSLTKDNNPFVSYEFLKSLELGKCVKDHSGWHPLYFIYQEEESLKAALVVYVKTDSYGEFIFDWDWARAYEQYGIPYYPKLTLAVPFSPISAPKLLGDLSFHKEKVLPALQSFFEKESVSSIHALFTESSEDPLFKSLGWMRRDSFQYHWKNSDYSSFEDFLAHLRKNKRKSIKKERRSIQNTDLVIEKKDGKDVSDEDLNFFYKCYLSTIEKKWSQAYLTKAFFQELLKNLPEQTHLILAKEDETRIACALYLSSDTTLFGRYWGCAKEVEFLHFELCIYQGIDLCIEKNLSVFEAGAQGEHKRLRGFDPVLTQSWHQLKHEDFSKAVGKFCVQESEYIERLFKDFEKESPYKKGD
ncbi:MAG: GNAT family N-acetyltransferase [Halobacteriovoraceae bacterium]|nr:GNAT family N-acetyltransferase [Halobacteriovoraceae bacterium]